MTLIILLKWYALSPSLVTSPRADSFRPPPPNKLTLTQYKSQGKKLYAFSSPPQHFFWGGRNMMLRSVLGAKNLNQREGEGKVQYLNKQLNLNSCFLFKLICRALKLRLFQSVRVCANLSAQRE